MPDEKYSADGNIHYHIMGGGINRNLSLAIMAGS